MKTKKRHVIIAVLMLSAVLSGCATSGDKVLKKTSEQQISASLIKGQSTKQEVRNLFGDPSEIDLLPDGKEHWKYSYTNSKPKVANFVPIFSYFYGGTDDNTKTLKLLFDNSGTLEFFAFANSKSETTFGLVK